MSFLFGPLFSESNAVTVTVLHIIRRNLRYVRKLNRKLFYNRLQKSNYVLSHTLRYVSYVHRETSVKETVYLSYY